MAAPADASIARPVPMHRLSEDVTKPFLSIADKAYMQVNTLGG